MSDTRKNPIATDVLARIAGHGHVRHFEKDEILLEEHDAPDGVYVLLKAN